MADNLVQDFIEETTILKLAQSTKNWMEDLQHIHWHAFGPSFDRVHELAEKYYDKASDDLDWLVEFVLTTDKQHTQKYDKDWVLENAEQYSLEDFMQFLEVKGTKYLQILQSFNLDIQDLQSYVDDMIGYWRKEILYKNPRRNSYNQYK